MTSARGFLLAMMDPPEGMEDEFNDWYDTEHFPERARLAGVLGAARYVSATAFPRYLAFYDLEDLALLDGPAYAAISGDNTSPWTRRIAARVRGMHRASGPQVAPAEPVRSRPAQVTLARFRQAPAAAEADLAAGLAAGFAEVEALIQVRLLKDVTPRRGFPETCDYLALVECRRPSPVPDLGRKGLGALADLVDFRQTYQRYWGRAAA